MGGRGKFATTRLGNVRVVGKVKTISVRNVLSDGHKHRGLTGLRTGHRVDQSQPVAGITPYVV